jgi:hypothetical protein
MNQQLELGLATPKTLAAYDLRDWDWRDCRNVRLAWNAASPKERREFCKRIKMPNWPINEEAQV